MSIIGLTDEKTIQAGSFPCLGTLNKGSAKEQKGEEEIWGKDLPTFRFTGIDRAVQAAWDTAFPEPPEALIVELAGPTVDEAFETYKAAFKASRMIHKCDGVTTSLLWLPERKGYSRKSHPCPGGCKETGRLKMIVPQLLQAGFVGYIELYTHSKWDCHDLTAEIWATEQRAQAAGRDLTGILFRLYKMLEAKSTPDGNRQKHWFLHIRPAVEWARARLEEGRAQAMKALSSTRVINGTTGEVTYTREKVITVQPEETAKESPTQADPAPPARAQAPEPVTPNGKPASIGRCANWRTAANEIAVKYPMYGGETPDFVGMLKIIKAAGIEKVVDANLEQAMNVLEEFAERIAPPNFVETDDILF